MEKKKKKKKKKYYPRGEERGDKAHTPCSWRETRLKRNESNASTRRKRIE